MALYDDFKKGKEAANAPTMKAGPITVPKPSLHQQFRYQKEQNGKPQATSTPAVESALASVATSTPPAAPNAFDRFKGFAGDVANKAYTSLVGEAGALRQLGKIWVDGAKNIAALPSLPKEERDNMIGGALQAPGDALLSLGKAVKDIGTIGLPKAIYTGVLAAAENSDKVWLPTGNPIIDSATRAAKWELPVPGKDVRKKVASWSQDVINYLGGEQRARIEELGITPDTSIFDAKNFGYQLGTGAGSMGLAIGATVLSKNPYLAASMLGWMEGSDTYLDAKEKLAETHPEWSPDDVENRALTLALIDAGGIAALEKLGLDALFRSYGRGILYKASINAITESAQEGSQTVYSNVVAKYGYDESREIFKDLVDTLIVTAPLGFLGGAGLGIGQQKGEAAEARVNASEGMDIDAAIEAGDIKAETVYADREQKILTPEYAEGRIKDVAAKVDQYQDGLGQELLDTLPREGQTMESIERAGDALIEREDLFLGADPDTAILDDAIRQVAEKHNAEAEDLQEAGREVLDTLRRDVADLGQGTQFKKQGEAADALTRDIVDKERSEGRDKTRADLVADQDVPIDEALADDALDNALAMFADETEATQRLIKETKKTVTGKEEEDQEVIDSAEAAMADDTDTDEEVELPKDVEEMLGELSDSDEMRGDWEENHAEDFAKLDARITEIAEEIKDLKGVKNKERRDELKKESAGLEKKAANMESDFIEKWRKEAARRVSRKETAEAVEATERKVAANTFAGMTPSQVLKVLENEGNKLDTTEGAERQRAVDRGNQARAYMNDFWEKNAETVVEVKGKGALPIVQLEVVQYDDGTWGVRSEGSIGDRGWSGPFDTETFATKEEAIASEMGGLVKKVKDAMTTGGRGKTEGNKALNALAPFMEEGDTDDDGDNDTRGDIQPEGDTPRGPDVGDGRGERGGADTELGDDVSRGKRSERDTSAGERSRKGELDEDASVGEQLAETTSDEERAEILEEDAEEHRESEGTSNEEIQAIVESLTDIDEATGEVRLKEGVFPDAATKRLVSLYTGAGGMERQGAEGRGLLDEYYTPDDVVFMVSEIIHSDLDATSGPDQRYLEPSAGTGAFMYPLKIGLNSYTDAYEINPVAARVLKVLRNTDHIFNKPFEGLFMTERGKPVAHAPIYDVVLGNPPYGQHRGKYLGLGEEPRIPAYEDYFLKRALDLTKDGGIVAMVVPSSFLRGSYDYAHEQIGKMAELVTAYRLPNGAFPTTTIGTDIVVLRKGKGETRPLLFGDNFFKENPQNVLGTPTEKKGRRGQMEPWVEGTLEEASDMFWAMRNRDFAAKQEPVDDEELTGIQDELDEAYNEQEYKEVRERPEVKAEKKASDKARTLMTPKFAKGQEVSFSGKKWTIGTVLPLAGDVKYELIPQKGTQTLWTNEAGLEHGGKDTPTTKAVKNASKTTITAPKKKGGTLDLAKYSTATEEEKNLWAHTTATGELDTSALSKEVLEKDAFYYRGEYFNAFNYLQGDIYDKLDALNEDADKIPLAQFQRQLKALKEILPERVTADRMAIGPNSRFAQETKITENGAEKPVATHFLEWVNTLPLSAFGDSTRWAIKGYVQNEPVRGGDKLRNEQERRTRRIEGDRLFKLYLSENLSDKSRFAVEEAYNKQFNAYHRPDYRKVPLVGKISDTFHGKPLEIKDVQLQGIGFLVNRGVGLLAHDVGIGKTMQTILAINETMARGWSKKPLIVVPSVNVYNQWIAEIQELVPGAKINLLANLGGDFKGDLKTLEIEAGTWSITTEEGFKKLGFMEDTYQDLTKDFADVLELPGDTKKSKRQEAKEEAQAEVLVGKGMRGTSDERFFEDLGFDLIAGDEIHNANHIIPRAKMDKKEQVSEFRAFQVRPSIFGVKMWLAAQYIQKMNGGRNTYFASATPFTNNPLEYYSILSLMARERMRRMGLLNVNDFMTAFMEISTQHEFKADGSYVEKGEVRSFKNYQQFQKLLTEFIDFRDGVEAGVKRPDRVGKEYMVGETRQATEYKELAQALFEDKKNAGTLKAIGELRAIAFSPYLSRYYDGPPPTVKQFVDNSPKIKTMVELVKQSLKDNPEGGHLVYSTVGVEYFPLIKAGLEEATGLKGSQVEIISGSTPKPKRSAIQAAFNRGEVKVVIGSDAIQEGVNLQQNTTDLYVLSLPWNFTGLRQVIGRAWRQGNRWPRVRVNSIFTENSIDVFLSQKLQNKEKRYAESLKFKGDTLDVGDIDFEEMKLDLITDPVRRTELDYQFRQNALELEIKRKLADQAYKNRRAVEYIEAKQKLDRSREMAKQYDWAQREVPVRERELEAVRVKLTERGIDVADLEKELADAETEVAQIKGQIELLKEEKAKAVAEAEAQRTPDTGTRETDYGDFVRARAEENASFYRGGPLFLRSYRALDGSSASLAWNRAMDGILTPEETEAVIEAQFQGITEANSPLVQSATKKYLDFMEKQPRFERELSTPILEDIGIRETVSRQFVEDLTRKQETKKAEREAILEALAEIPGTGDVNVQVLTDKVLTKLLPLEAKSIAGNDDIPRYEGRVLEDDKRGPVYAYDEVIYESPIKTSAARYHFNGESDAYFAHVRREDMAKGFDEDRQPDEAAKIRRVIEIQSDLFQRGRLEDEGGLIGASRAYGKYVEELGGTPTDVAEARDKEIAALKIYRQEWWNRIVREEVRAAAKDGYKALRFPTGETIMKIEALGDGATWIIAKGNRPGNPWEVVDEKDLVVGAKLRRDDEGEDDIWVVTDVIGGGVFKAVLAEEVGTIELLTRDPRMEKAVDRYIATNIKDRSDAALEQAYANMRAAQTYPRDEVVEIDGVKYRITGSSPGVNGAFFVLRREKLPEGDELLAEIGKMDARFKEEFDVSGKADEKNPVYRFYENDIQRYLRRIRPDLRRVTDEQGVSWFETSLTKEDKKRPVMAFQRTRPTPWRHEATTFAEAKKTLEAYKERFRLDFDIDFANVILTGEMGRDSQGNMVPVKAHGVTYNNRITLAENVTRTTADHEFVHIISENIEQIPAFKGITKVDLLKSVNGGRDYTANDVEMLEEKLAIGFQEYLEGIQAKRTTVIERFYQLLRDLLTDFMRAIGADIPVIQDFYDRIRRAKGAKPVQLEIDRLDMGPVVLYPNGSLVLDFGLADKQVAFDGDLRSSFFERIAEMEIEDQNMDLTRKDINALEDITAQARDIYLRDPNEFAAAKTFEKVAQVRRMKKSALDQKWSKMLAPYYAKDLSKSERDRVNDVLMEGDKQGKEFSDAELSSLNLNAKQTAAYKAVRKAFNLAHELLLSRMAENGMDPLELETFLGQREGYMPHKWKYRFVVKRQVDDGKGFKTVEMQDFKTKALAEKAFEAMKAGNQDDRTRFVLDTLDNLEVDFFTEQRLSFENMKSAIVQARTGNDVKKVMIDALRNMVKEKGFGRHYIRRMGIEGYELQAVPTLIANYFAGLDGYITKMEAAPQYFAALQAVDARRQSRFYSWLRDAIAYDMGNTKEWDRLKQLAFIYYLANDISFLVTNATQNFIVGTGELGKHMEGKQFSLKPEVMITKAMSDWWTKNVTPDERQAIENLLLLGELGGEMAAEMMGFKNNPLYTEISSGFQKGMYATTAMVERDVNRVPMFLAARRLFKEQGMSDKDANEKAIEVSEDVHFRYGRQHRPRMMRGALLGSLFVFNHYIRSFLYQLSRNVTKGEYATFARKMLYTALIGGATSLPFAQLLISTFRQIFGTACAEDGDETACKSELEMSLWEIAIKKGLPATVGIDLSGRVGIELMSVNSIMEDPGDVKSWIGAAGNLIWIEPDADERGRLGRGFELLFQGRMDDAAAHLLPDMFANPIKAFTGYNWGVRSFAGTPLTDEHGDALKYSAWEAFIRATGFVPTRENLAWDEKSKEFVAQDKEGAASSNIRRTIQGQLQRGDYEGARQTQDAAIEKGVIPSDRNYIRELGKDTFIREAIEEWNAGEQTRSRLDDIEDGIIEKLYGPDPSDQKKNNIRREFTVYRTFGLDNDLVDDMLSAGSNAEKVELLKEAEASLGKEAFLDFWKKGRKKYRTEAGSESPILISDELRELYLESRKDDPDHP